ncbi:hypothetical protein BCV72DRAFT_215394 [Rhizopus microsporus var. microsporus]|uniref:Uncharacterized protein n=1 Tax=Rhizopus microsporus var. microsporus TaxID=86635 RepID=A0A1X0QRK0_RHIZD|nr:hypothetical protein BCV72DRAFT_215394 [Rhizopus microsporus var. microsporus]
MKFSPKLYHDKCNEKLVKNLKNKFGPDAVLVIGDWSAPSMKFHELELFKKAQNPRKKQKVNRETVICHGLLR